MVMPNLTGPTMLTAANVDFVISKRLPGVYVLGPIENSRVSARYVGRSDSDVCGRLKQHIGKYNAFAFGYASSAMAAFQMECELFHGLRPRDNVIHPDRPADANWKCPVCAVYG